LVRSIISALILTAFLVQSISKTIIVMQFQANRKFIEKNLCIKRNESENCCKGGCQLKKQLDRDEKYQGSDSDKLKHKFEKDEFYNNAFGIKINSKCVAEGFGDYQLILLPVACSSVFHPPPYLV
jgi:hypothetical protein